MMDWATISSLATAGGTLVLAVATFSATRSANRSARIAERSFQASLRPLLMPSRLEDSTQKIRWVDDYMARLDGGRALALVREENIYLAMSVRNAGNGIAVIDAWHVNIETDGSPERQLVRNPPLVDRDRFRRQLRDLYIAAGDIGFWQAAIRDRDDELYSGLVDVIQGRQTFTIDVLYGDHQGEQHAISRFVVTPVGEGSEWMCSVGRHWNLDAPDPRHG